MATAPDQPCPDHGANEGSRRGKKRLKRTIVLGHTSLCCPGIRGSAGTCVVRGVSASRYSAKSRSASPRSPARSRTGYAQPTTPSRSGRRHWSWQSGSSRTALGHTPAPRRRVAGCSTGSSSSGCTSWRVPSARRSTGRPSTSCSVVRSPRRPRPCRWRPRQRPGQACGRVRIRGFGWGESVRFQHIVATRGAGCRRT
jgi:hypothetical protein